MACLEVEKVSKAAGLSEIAVINEFERQGWVYESPAKCQDLVHTPAGKLKLLIAADTHMW